MLIVLAERLAQILEWLKNVAGYSKFLSSSFQVHRGVVVAEDTLPEFVEYEGEDVITLSKSSTASYMVPVIFVRNRGI